MHAPQEKERKYRNGAEEEYSVRYKLGGVDVSLDFF